MRRPFEMVDVFGSGGLSGNPLAVVRDAEGLSDEEMLTITRWLNLSETTFLLPPTSDAADYRVRIFTLRGELPFAGHPTLGTCHVWLGGDGDPERAIFQECGAGLVELRSDEMLSFAAPPMLQSGEVDADVAEAVLQVLGLDAGSVVEMNWIDNGPGWIGVLLEDRDAVLAVEPDITRWGRDEGVDIGVAALHGEDGVDLEVRGFFSDHRGQLAEDPVTGSLNASLAQWLISSGRLPTTYVAAQGTALGRRGRVYVTADADGQVWVGGKTETVVSGEISIS